MRLIGVVLLSLAARAAAAQTIDSVKVILDRYVDAVGGRQNVERVQTRVTTWNMWLARGINGKLETIQSLPEKVHERGTASGWGWHGTFEWGTDGRSGWIAGPEEPLRSMSDTFVRQRVVDNRLDRDAKLEELFPERSLRPDTLIGGRNQNVLLMTTEFGSQELWRFDAATGLLTQTEWFEDNGGKDGRVKVVTTFEDYRSVDGLRLPFKKTVQEGKHTRILTAASITNNKPVSPGEFVRPQR
jgi:hypothetical protein